MLDEYLMQTLGIYYVEGGRHIISLPYYEDIVCDTLEELMEVITYDMNEWRKQDED